MKSQKAALSDSKLNGLKRITEMCATKKAEIAQNAISAFFGFLVFWFFGFLGLFVESIVSC